MSEELDACPPLPASSSPAEDEDDAEFDPENAKCAE
jgi:hypothetical protein